jgi:hypothetical protein
MTYRVLTHSRRIEKDFLRIITGFSEDEQNTIWQILRLTPKGSGETHWTIKKLAFPFYEIGLCSCGFLAHPL